MNQLRDTFQRDPDGEAKRRFTAGEFERMGMAGIFAPDERVEASGTARHRAGVPMLEQAAGGKHQRKLGIGQLIGRHEVGGHDLGAA